jgi:hypothetical protein
VQTIGYDTGSGLPCIVGSVSTCSGTPGAYGARVAVTSTRPANTTTYAANTAWANATSGATYLTFPNVCRANGGASISADVVFLDNANQTTKLNGVLFLFNAPVATPINDNATFSVAAADAPNLVAQIPFTTSTVVNQGAGSAGSAMAEVQGSTYQFNCGPSSTSLYGMVEVTNAYVPISGEALTAILKPIGVN